MKQKISKLEDVNISAKPWQQLGETSSKARPMNSLLEEHVTFDHTSVGSRCFFKLIAFLHFRLTFCAKIIGRTFRANTRNDKYHKYH